MLDEKLMRLLQLSEDILDSSWNFDELMGQLERWPAVKAKLEECGVEPELLRKAFEMTFLTLFDAED